MRWKRKFYGLPRLRWWLTWESATSSLVGSNLNPEEGTDMNDKKPTVKDSSVSMDPAIPGTKPLEVEELGLELAAPVVEVAAPAPAADPICSYEDLGKAVAQALVSGGNLVEGKVSILPAADGIVEVLLHLPNLKPATQGVFRLV